MARVERDVENANLPESDDAEGADSAAAVATRQLTRGQDADPWTDDLDEGEGEDDEEQDADGDDASGPAPRRGRRPRTERGLVWWRPEGRARPEGRRRRGARCGPRRCRRRRACRARRRRSR